MSAEGWEGTVRPESKLLVAPGDEVDTAVGADGEGVGGDDLVVGGTVGGVQVATTYSVQT